MNHDHYRNMLDEVRSALRAGGLDEAAAKRASFEVCAADRTEIHGGLATIEVNGKKLHPTDAARAWLASNGPNAKPAKAPPRRTADASQFDLTTEDGAVEAALAVFESTRR